MRGHVVLHQTCDRDVVGSNPAHGCCCCFLMLGVLHV